MSDTLDFDGLNNLTPATLFLANLQAVDMQSKVLEAVFELINTLSECSMTEEQRDKFNDEYPKIFDKAEAGITTVEENFLKLKDKALKFDYQLKSKVEVLEGKVEYLTSLLEHTTQNGGEV